jgi:hypothetical protein
MDGENYKCYCELVVSLGRSDTPGMYLILLDVKSMFHYGACEPFILNFQSNWNPAISGIR